MRRGRVLSTCAILPFFLFFGCLSQDYKNGRPLVTSLCMSRSSSELENRIFVAENPVCAVLPTLSLGSLNIVVCPVNNSCNFAGNYVLSSWSWKDIITQTNEAPVLKYITARSSFQRRRKIRRHGRPRAYYSKTTATFHDLLIGDLVFKLNPGPTGERMPVIVSTRSDYRHIAQSTMPSRNAGNLININCSAGLSLNGYYNHPMTLCTFNARSVKNKSAAILDYICDCKADLFAITETWLSADDAAVRTELCPEGYKFIDHPRLGRSGGGTGLVYRDSLGIKKADAGEKESFEFSEWTVTSSSSRNLRVVIVYRPPYSDEHRVSTNVFFTEFSIYLESILLSKEQLLITGDFNIHVDAVDDPDSLKLLDLLESVGLRQHVSQPTHVHGHTLDLIITRWSDQIIQDPPQTDRFISDHASLLCKLLQDKPAVTTKKVTYRRLKSVDLDSLKADLAASGLCQEQPDELTNVTPEGVDALLRNYNKTLSRMTNCHAPIKTKTLRARPRVPWYNADVDAAKRIRRKAERTWRKTKLLSNLIIFKSKKNHVTHLMNQVRQVFYTNFMDENSADQGRLFRATKILLFRKDELSFPDYHDKTALASDINGFFVRKITRIRSDIDATGVDDGVPIPPEVEVVPTCLSLSAFHPVTENDVLGFNPEVS